MYQRQVSFTEAIKMALQQNYCNFSGRSSRSEYWWYSLFTFILGFIIAIFAGILGENAGNALTGIVYLALLLPGLGLTVRRLHDINKSGWWILINLIPLVGWIIMLIWLCKDSDSTDNQYGPVPNVVG